MADRELVTLRRTFTPYWGNLFIFTGITLFVAYAIGYKASGWKDLWVVLIFWLYFAFFVYLTLKYRVLWDDKGLVMCASGLTERRMQYDEITEVRKEFAGPSEWLSQSRPFRRIAVYGRKHKPRNFIDISLRHFRLDDIKTLLSEIQAHRPDLSIPEITPHKESVRTPV